jgi:hypothetical protein
MESVQMKKVTRRNLYLGAAAAAATGMSLISSVLSKSATEEVNSQKLCEPLRASKNRTTAFPSTETAAFIQSRQERHYRILSDELGLGGDPARAFRSLTRGVILPVQAHAWVEQQRQRYANSLDMSAEDWTTVDSLLADRAQQMRSTEIPTAYEEPILYDSLMLTYSRLADVLDRDCNYTSPALATLAAGEINAKISSAGHNSSPVIFFEHGLFRYFWEASNVLGWCLPQIKQRELLDVTSIANIPNRYSMPSQATAILGELLHNYVVDGVPWRARGQLPRADHNILLIIALVSDMECFALAHEISHIRLGHLDEQILKQSDEAAADLAGTELVLALDPRHSFNRAFRFWACYLALCTLEILDRALILYAFGNKPVKWINELYPDFPHRRDLLRTALAQGRFAITDFEVATAERLCRMSDALISLMWKNYIMTSVLSTPLFPKPSPMWRNRINACYAQRDT